MNVSTFDLNHAKVLHYLLEEAHVGRAAARLGITPAAASNALRRLRVVFDDPLLAKKGRGLIRTRVGDELRLAASDVVSAAERLVVAARPFSAADYRGPLPMAMADHVAAMLLPTLDRLTRERAPLARLVVSAVPAAVADWLERSAGVLVGPSGPYAATEAGDSLVAEDFYEDRYVCLMRRGHPAHSTIWDAVTYAAQSHVLITPRGRSARSDVDDWLEARGLTRNVVRVLPTFALALPLIEHSDLIITMPERSAHRHCPGSLAVHPLPLPSPVLRMKLIAHPTHAGDARTTFVKALLHSALQALPQGGID